MGNGYRLTLKRQQAAYSICGYDLVEPKRAENRVAVRVFGHRRSSRIMKTFSFALLITLLGCGPIGLGGTASGKDGEGEDRTDAGGNGADVNPQGSPYPAGPYGVGKRGSPTGKVRGDTIKNFKFLGYPKSDKSGGLKTVALADWFNPDGRNGNFKLIHIHAAGSWCIYCRNEQDMVTPKMPEIEAAGVVWLTVVVEGETPGAVAEMVDLDTWVARHKTVNTVVIDSANKNLGSFFRQAAVPWNGWVDARTMEILTYQEGAPLNYGAIATEIEAWLKFIEMNPVQ